MKITKFNILTAACLLMAFASCKKLSLQKDYEGTPHTLDPKIHKTAGKYLTDRATGVASQGDTIFAAMLRGLKYAEIDLAEFEKEGRTFILLHNDAVRRVVKVSGKDSMQSDCFFGANFVNGKPAQKWEDYPKDFVKTYFLYLIVTSVKDHYTMKEADENYLSATLAPEGSLTTQPAGITRHSTWPFLSNPKSEMRLKVVNASPSNTSDYPIMLNDTRAVRTSSIQADNGAIHVIDRYLSPTLIPF